MQPKPTALFAIITLLFSCACSSGGKQPSSAQADMARGQHTAESNPVEVIRLERGTFRKQIVSNGRLGARSKSVIGFRTQGTIELVNVSNGSAVRKGDVLAVLDKSDALSTLNTARQNLEKANIDLSDAIIGFGFDGRDTTSVPAATLATAKVRSGYNSAVIAMNNARKELEACTLRAPFAGKVANLKSKAHERAAAEFCTIIDDSQMDVDFSVIETELGFIAQGGEVTVVPFTGSGAGIPGNVTAINPMVDDKGQVQVRAKIAGRRGFMDGMNVKVYIEREVPGQLVVPKSAMVIRDNLEVVFRYSQGKAIWTYIHTTMDNSEQYAVEPNTSRLSELNAGDTVIVSGNLNLANDSQVKIKEK